jgi:hypothetical protein
MPLMRCHDTNIFTVYELSVYVDLSWTASFWIWRQYNPSDFSKCPPVDRAPYCRQLEPWSTLLWELKISFPVSMFCLQS